MVADVAPGQWIQALKGDRIGEREGRGPEVGVLGRVVAPGAAEDGVRPAPEVVAVRHDRVNVHGHQGSQAAARVREHVGPAAVADKAARVAPAAQVAEVHARHKDLAAADTRGFFHAQLCLHRERVSSPRLTPLALKVNTVLLLMFGV
jgi:hypothetical protein